MSSEAVTECRIETGHEDQILDVAFNHYGSRMATSGSDGTIKVWSQDGKNQWKCSASWTCREPVFRIAWAHPEFGEVLATSSLRRTAVIWQEVVDQAASSPAKVVHKWVRKADLVDSTTTVTDVKFAPHHLGLQLATCSAKGMVYIYEAPDVMNLTQWTMQHQINCDMPCSCLSWSTNKLYNPMLAVGSDDPSVSGGKVVIYECNEHSQEWVQIRRVAQVMDPVNDVKFAPNIGLSYHQLAVAAADLYIFHLKPNDDDEDDHHSHNNGGGYNNAQLNMNQVARFSDHGCNVLRVTWNDFGDLLISNGDDGQILVWVATNATLNNKWQRVGHLKHGSSAKSGYSLIYNGYSLDNTAAPYY